MRALSFLVPCVAAAACSIPGKHLITDDGPPGPTDAAVDGNEAADAPIDADTKPDAPIDGMVTTGTRALQIVVADVTVTDASAKPPLNLRGGVVTASVRDLTKDGGEVLFGTPEIGKCIVIKYDLAAGKKPNPMVNAGTITITNSTKPISPCTAQAAAQNAYQCVRGSGTNVLDASVPQTSVTSFAFESGGNFTAGQLVGSWLEVKNMPNDHFNGTFPIVANQATSIQVANGAATAAETAQGNAPWRIVDAFSPGPSFPDFLGDETATVKIDKPANANWGAISASTAVRGQGFTLTGRQPDQALPRNGTDATFTCSGTGCGSEPNTSWGKGMIITGRTTDAPIPNGAPDFAMPPPNSKWTEFQCSVLNADTITLPAEAITAIYSTSPTRVEVGVARVVALLISDSNDSKNAGFAVVGHMLVGHH
jgi:hypothetical protein